jgi:tRNA nucleotidyltransferase/poly(A) polymerase
VSAVDGKCIEQDLKRRDFCMNAMAWQPATEQLIDPLSGTRDLRDRQIRMVSRAVFEKDPVRLIRAYRLAAELQFSINADTSAAIAEFSRLIGASPGERIWSELSRLLNSDSAHCHLTKMAESGVLESFIPEFGALKGCDQGAHHQLNAYDHTLAALKYLEASLKQDHDRPTGLSPQGFGLAKADRDGRGPLKLAVLLHDIAKPVTRQIGAKGKIHFYGHATLGARMALRICERLRTAHRTSEYIAFVIQHHLHPLALYTAGRQQALGRRALTRFFMKCREKTPDILLHAWADMQAKGKADPEGEQDFGRFLADLAKAYQTFEQSMRNEPMLVDGNDLIGRLGLKPGPLFGRILKAVHTAQLAGELKTRSAALDWVADWLAERGIRPHREEGR